MRVKKLSANRRPKAGDDDDSNASSSSPPAHPQQPHKWVSPSKPEQQRTLAFGSSGSGSEIGSSSPTDPSGVHPIELSDSVQAQLFVQTPPSPALGRGSVSPPQHQLAFGNALSMANNHHQMPAARDASGRKPTASTPTTAGKKANSASSWRAHVANALRDSIHTKIVEYLRALKPNAPEKVLARLPGLATRMEESLLQLAASQDEYADLKTLALRLSAIQQSNTKKLLQQQTAATASPRTSSSGGVVSALAGRAPLSEDQARFVFQCLQSWRQKLVNMYGVDPWEILSNPILAKVAVLAPSTEQELAVCGVQDAQIARFGSSLLQELQRICGSTRSASPSGAKARSSSVTAAANAAKASRKAELSKRPQEPKKRKTSALAPASDSVSAPRLAAANSFITTSANGSSTPSAMMAPSQLLFRPNGMDSLPTLLPSTASANAVNGSSSSSSGKPQPPTSYNPVPARLSPGAPQMQAPAFFATRLPSPHGATSGSTASVLSSDESHMHLLAQGAGHVSKHQQTAKTLDAYEKELQSLRWMLQQSQHEKAQLEDEVQRLRRQLGAQGVAGAQQ